MSVSTGLLPSSRETYSVLKAVGLDGMERAEALPSCSTSVLVRCVIKVRDRALALSRQIHAPVCISPQ